MIVTTPARQATTPTPAPPATARPDALPANISPLSHGLGAASSSDGADVRSLYASAHDLLEAGRVDDALRAFMDIAHGCQEMRAAAFYDIGCIYQNRGRGDGAVLAFKRALDADPTHVNGMLRIAEVHQSKGLIQEAGRYYVAAAESALLSGDNAAARQIAYKALALNSANHSARAVLAELAEEQRQA